MESEPLCAYVLSVFVMTNVLSCLQVQLAIDAFIEVGKDMGVID